MTSANYSLAAPAALVLLGALLYLLGVARAWRHAGLGRAIPGTRVVAGLLGFAALAVALSPPLEALSSLLFSAHMSQHLLLTLVAAPLLVVGVPMLALLWLLPPAMRRRAAFSIRGSRAASGAWDFVTNPVVAWSGFVLLLWAWHLPAAYEAALVSGALHILEHLSLTVVAVLFWWVLFQPLGRRRLDRFAAPLLLFLTALQGGVLGAMLTLSPRPWYAHYERVARAEGFSAIADQQLAGLLMWVPPATLYLGVASWMLYRTLTKVESRQKLPEVTPLAHLNTLLPLALPFALALTFGAATGDAPILVL